MALRIVASRPDPAIVTLPWSEPLEEWGDAYVVPLPRGLSRHVVRIVRLHDRVYAVKETVEEHRLPRVPAAARPAAPRAAGGGAAGRRHRAGRPDGEALPSRAAHRAPALLAALPQPVQPTASPPTTCPRWSTRSSCCWSACTWPTSSGATCRCPTCCSGAAPAGSRRTSWTPRPASCKPSLSQRMREYDVTIATENVFAELLDLQASDAVERTSVEAARHHRVCSRSATRRCGPS